MGVGGSAGGSGSGGAASEGVLAPVVLSDDSFEVERGQLLQAFLNALSADPGPSPDQAPQVKIRQPVLEFWPELSKNESGRLAVLSPPAPLQKVQPVKAVARTSWLDGQMPLVPLAVPLWKVAEGFSTFIPDSWRPVLVSQYLLWGSLLILVLYPAWRLIAQEIAYRREERELSLYD